jgi:hypothetical protein
VFSDTESVLNRATNIFEDFSANRRQYNWISFGRDLKSAVQKAGSYSVLVSAAVERPIKEVAATYTKSFYGFS